MPLEKRDYWTLGLMVLGIAVWCLLYYLNPPPLRELMHDVKP